MVIFSLESFWNDYSPYYSKLGLSPVFQRLVFDTVEQARVIRGQRVLDLGCGPGYFLAALVERGGRVTTVDYSEEMLARARQALSTAAGSPANPEIEFVLDEANHFLQNVPDCAFDTVIASLFLSYLPNPEAVLSQIFRVLRPKGRFVMSNPVPSPGFAKVFWQSGWTAIRHLFTALQLLKYAGRIERLGKVGVFHFFDYSETRDLLHHAGFDERSVTIALSFADTAFLSTAIKPSPQ